MSGFETALLLPDCGFERAAEGELHDWRYERHPLSLEVVIGPNRHFQPCLNFAGQYNDGRTMRFLEFSIGKQTASREEAMALIAFNFDGLPRDKVPAWVIGGWALSDHLPWRQEKA